MLGKILKAVTRRQSGPVVLFGDGGRGKTALAAEAVRALVKTHRIAWTSADGREDFSLSTLLDDIASQLGAPELRREALEAKKEALRTMLSTGLTLIMLDNFETVSDLEQQSCISWLLKFAPCPSLITTRQRIPAVLNIRVDEMTGDEARAFTERLIEQANDPDTFKGLDLDSISGAAEYNPLIIGWVVGQIDLAQSYDEVLNDLSHGKGDAAERVFDRSFELEQLTDDGRDTLLALSLFVPSASRIALAEVAGFGGDTDCLNKAVSRLAALRMVKPLDKGNRLSVEGLTRDFAAARLSRNARADEFRRRFTKYFLSYSEEHKETTTESHDALEAEKDNLVTAIETAFNLQEWGKVMQLVYIVASRPQNMMDVRGYWSEGITCGKLALKSARQSKSDSYIAAFANNLGILYQERGEFDEAHKLYNESFEISKKLNYQDGLALTLNQLGILAQLQGKIDEAYRLFNESLEISKKLNIRSTKALALHQLGILAQAQGEFDEANNFYNESFELRQELGDQSGIASTLHELGRLARAQGHIKEARRLCKESLEIVKKLGDQSSIAITLGQIGQLAEDEGNKDEAAHLYREALNILDKLRSPYAELARKSLARVTD